MKNDHFAGIETLILKYLKGTLTGQEKEILNAWRKELPENESLFADLTNDQKLTEEFKIFRGINQEKGSKKLSMRIVKGGSTRVVRLLRLYWSAAASIVLLVVSYWAYRNLNMPHQEAEVEVAAAVVDIPAPAASHAMITLSNGERIILDSVGKGVMARQGQVELIKSDDGGIEYRVKKADAEGALSYNLLANPRGSKIVAITLSDGTRIWLNSESTLRYPAYFKGQERRVEITGEAYLEVAHNVKQPFVVVKQNTEVTVLGTRFNVNTYEEEPSLKITLLEGKVAVKHNDRSALLMPGQQAVIDRGEGRIEVMEDMDPGDAIAWLNGQFVMDGTRLTSLMNQISRWYNVEIAYTGKIPNKAFGGMINRDIPLSRMLEALRENGISCRLEEGKVIIGN